MVIYDYPKYDKNGIFIDHTNICAMEYSEILVSLSAEKEEHLRVLLNKINNQGIQSFDSKTYSYILKDTQLSWDYLGSAERLFVIAYLARESKRDICITGHIKSLRSDTLRLFMSEFGSCEYVDIMLPYEDILYTTVLRTILEEVLHG